jgi:hypothetical protein
MSTSAADITPHNPGTLVLTRPQLTPGPPPTYGAKSGSITFNVADLNGNAMPAGTTVTVVADAAIGAISPTSGSFVIGCDAGLGGQTFTSYLTTTTSAGSGNITVTVTSPGTKTVTLYNVPVTVN